MLESSVQVLRTRSGTFDEARLCRRRVVDVDRCMAFKVVFLTMFLRFYQQDRDLARCDVTGYTAGRLLHPYALK
jgi:hypothetical protein